MGSTPAVEHQSKKCLACVRCMTKGQGRCRLIGTVLPANTGASADASLSTDMCAATMDAFSSKPRPATILETSASSLADGN